MQKKQNNELLSTNRNYIENDLFLQYRISSRIKTPRKRLTPRYLMHRYDELLLQINISTAMHKFAGRGIGWDQSSHYGAKTTQAVIAQRQIHKNYVTD